MPVTLPRKAADLHPYGIEQSDLPDFESGRIDPRTWFAHPERRLEIEIGSGKGTFLVQRSAACGDVNLLGIERAGEYYRFAADRMRRRGLENVRILHGDAVEFIRFWCADEVAAVVHLYFSDPWPKKRHHKRRVLQEQTLGELHRVLREAGELRLVTDHDELWQWYQQLAKLHRPLFDPQPFEPPAGSEELVGTNFERKYAREGRPFHAMTLVKRDS